MNDADATWLTLGDLAERFGVSPGRVHRMIEERMLLAVREKGIWKIPSSFVDGDQPLPALQGTLVVLADAGYTDADALAWMTEEQPELGTSPIQALHDGRKREVRRVAQSLAF